MSDHVLYTVVISYNRRELLERTLRSYFETVTLPYDLLVVDNGSGAGTQMWLQEVHRGYYRESRDTSIGGEFAIALNSQNLYPGRAANQGFKAMRSDATLLHRSDNDMEYLPGWCEEVVERFKDPTLGQLGLRTLKEEGNHAAVGGNAVFRRELWDKGLRYDERPWTEVPFEDATMSRKVQRMGYRWERVQRPCALHIGIASRADAYYQKSFSDRGITFEQWGVE